jgi:hypothetical protein
MGIVRFALRFPHTFYVVAALILFLGVAAIRSMPTDIFENLLFQPPRVGPYAQVPLRARAFLKCYLVVRVF